MADKKNNKRVIITSRVVFSKITIINTALLLLVYFVLYRAPNFLIINFDPKSLVTISVTGLSFSLALFVATKNLYSLDDLATIYEASQESADYEKTFDGIFSRFMWTAILWMALGMLSILSFFKVSIDSHLLFLLKQYYFVFLVYLLLMSLFNLFNLMMDINRETKMAAIRKYEQQKHLK